MNMFVILIEIIEHRSYGSNKLALVHVIIWRLTRVNHHWNQYGDNELNQAFLIWISMPSCQWNNFMCAMNVVFPLIINQNKITSAGFLFSVLA